MTQFTLFIGHFNYYRVSGKLGRMDFPDNSLANIPFSLTFYCKCHQIDEKLKELSTSLLPPGKDLID